MSDVDEGAVPRLSKTASTAIAALVVAAAAAASSVHAPLGSSSGRTSAVAASASPSAASVVSSEVSTSREATGDRARAHRAPPPGSLVLVIGRTPALHPSGGAARSFVCRAATSLRYRCWVWDGRNQAPPGTAGLVLIVLGSQDGADTVQAALTALPARDRRALVVVLGPIAARTTDTQARRLAGIRAAVAARGARFIDPLQQGWVSEADAARYLGAKPDTLTTAGNAAAATLLADALRAALTG